MVRNFFLLAVAATLLALGLSYLVLVHEPSDWLGLWINRETEPLLFLLFMLVLPVFGVSIVLFLVLAGVKFGAAVGLLASAVAMAVHLLATYGIAHSLLKERIDRLLHKERASPDLLHGKSKQFAVLFMLLPGLPYAVKNYLLALSGLPLPQYLLIGWSTHLLMGIPLIIFGKVLTGTGTPLAYLLLILLVCAFGLPRLRKRYFRPQTRAAGD